MIDNTVEYILCSAIWYDDGKPITDTHTGEFPSHCKNSTASNIPSGFVLCGRRHHNIISVLPTNPTKNGGIVHTVQGFLTSKGRFVDRYQAMMVAYGANQVHADTVTSDNRIPGCSTIDRIMSEAPSDLANDHTPCPIHPLYSEDLY